MVKRVYNYAVVVAVFAFLATALLGSVLHSAQAQVDVFPQCTEAGSTAICQNRDTGVLFGGGGIWANIIRIVTIIIGGVSVLMIVIGGFRYVTSGGDSSATKSAKDTILYALIGLVIAIMANTIVNFVVNNI